MGGGGGGGRGGGGGLHYKKGGGHGSSEILKRASQRYQDPVWFEIFSFLRGNNRKGPSYLLS